MIEEKWEKQINSSRLKLKFHSKHRVEFVFRSEVNFYGSE